jgi:hypothetical protein
VPEEGEPRKSEIRSQLRSPYDVERPAQTKEESGRSGRLGPKPRVPFGTQEFHFRADLDHSRPDALIFFDDARNGSCDRTLADEALQLFVGAQAQHLFAAAGSISFPEIEKNDIEQALEFKGSLGRKHGYELFRDVVGGATRED